MLHLVGETIDKHRVHYGVETGRLVRIMRGIYVAAEDDADAVLFDHALRIAAHLYPNTYLCGFSAERLAPTPDRRLFLGGRRNARTRLRDLEIIQTHAPDAPETEVVQVADPMGDFSVRRSTLRFRYLESFRKRSEAGAAMPLDMQVDIAARLVEAAAGRQGAIIACWRLGEANGWRAEAVRGERLIATPPRETPPSMTAFHVGWHGEKVGLLSHDGSAWWWKPAIIEGPTPVRTGLPGRLPPFIESLLPEGWLERVLKPTSQRERISGTRYMSNIVISREEDDLQGLPADVLEGRLERFVKEGVFVGDYAGPAPSFDETLEDRLAGLYASTATPRLSGVQIKAPLNLSHDGMLRPARDQRAFTHILKPSPGAGFEELPLVEAACLEAARACGIGTAVHAIVPMPDDVPDALLVERFDIRRDRYDHRKIAMEDMASVRGVAPSEKYQGSIEQVARVLRGVSSDAEADVLELLRRSLFAWLIADGDFHLKNMAVLRVAPDGARNFLSVRFAPAFDVVTTRVFPGLESDDLPLSLAGKRNRLSFADFVRAGATMDIDAHLVRDCVESLCARLGAHLEGVEPVSRRVARALETWRQRIESLSD